MRLLNAFKMITNGNKNDSASGQSGKQVLLPRRQMCPLYPYRWMTGGGGGGGGGSASGASTPRPVAASGGSGTVTPAAQAPEKALVGRKRKFGEGIEQTETGAGIQLRDLIHVLESDGREKKTLTLILARMKNTDKDPKPETHQIGPAVPGRV